MISVRIKFAKFGSMKFIAHLDVMRYFQKAVRRAGLDVAYSDGFNPHQIMSFAAPLGLGQTSEGEYVDIDFHSVPSLEEVCDRLNAAMTDGVRILGASFLPEWKPNQKKETAMSQVAASSYLLLHRDGYEEALTLEQLRNALREFLSQEHIVGMKKSKTSETEIDLSTFIFDFDVEAVPTEFCDSYTNGICFYLLLSAGSVNNVKPETVMEAFYRYLGQEYQPYAYAVHRLETYADFSLKQLTQAEIARLASEGKMPERKLVSLLDYYKELAALQTEEQLG